MRALGRSARASVYLLVPLLIVSLYAGFAASPSEERIIVNLLIAVVLVVGIQLFSGNSGILTFGHVAFLGVGAYVAAIATMSPERKAATIDGMPSFLVDFTLGPVPALALGGLSAALVALIVGLVLTRMPPFALAMSTIGVLVIFIVCVEGATTITKGPTGLSGIPIHTTVFSAMAVAAAAIILARWFRESATGVRLRASREDETAAAVLGIHVERMRLRAWVLSALIMGVGGAVWAQYSLAFGPGQLYFDRTFALLAPLVLGGLLTVSGAVVGAVIYAVIVEALKPVQDGFELGFISVGAIPGLTPIVLALLLFLVLRFRPHGLMGSHEIDETFSRIIRKRRSAGDDISPGPTQAVDREMSLVAGGSDESR
jgi:branched-chain amino acid transport system permease protein